MTHFSTTAIPGELAELPQWVLWKYVDARKIPFQPQGDWAKSNDSQTWSTLKACQGVVSQYEGLGFVFSSNDNFIGIDLDGCRDPENGIIAPWGLEILQEFEGTYSETSPSGTGIKIYAATSATWDAPHVLDIDAPNRFGKKPQVEVYQHGRYFCFTGELFGEITSVTDQTEAILRLREKFPKPPPPPTTTLPSITQPRATAPNALDRCRTYVAKLPAAISGQGGSNVTLQAAAECYRFGLSDGDAWSLMCDYNLRCEPRWSEKELRHKLDDARTKVEADREIGSRLTEPSANSHHRFAATPTDQTTNNWLKFDSLRTDNELATRFVDRQSGDLRYVPKWNKWLVWDDRRWVRDEGSKLVLRKARQFAKSLWTDFAEMAADSPNDELLKARTFCRNANCDNGIRAFLNLATADERILVTHDLLNAKPHLLNIENGTIDLLTGELLPHRRENLLTQLANVSYDKNADCQRWLDVLDVIFAGDADLMRYVQQLLGYSISGDIGEHILPIAYGTGCNGKSTLWNAIVYLLGDYAALANESLLLGFKDSHPTEKVFLYQKRFVPISEPERSASLREARVKELTGDGVITGRGMREDYWSFARTHTFWLSTNHRPRVSGNDEGIWRRIRLIPFTVDLRAVTTPIPGLAESLAADEGPGILNWLIAGFRDWRANGFVEPSCVTAATRAYRGEEDHIGQFIAECCVVEQGSIATADELYGRYETWAGSKPWTKTSFGKEIAERFEKDRPTSGEHRKKTVYFGLRLGG